MNEVRDYPRIEYDLYVPLEDLETIRSPGNLIGTFSDRATAISVASGYFGTVLIDEVEVRLERSRRLS